MGSRLGALMPNLGAMDAYTQRKHDGTRNYPFGTKNIYVHLLGPQRIRAIKIRPTKNMSRLLEIP